MNAKIERVCKEIDKTKDRISEQQARLRELEKQKTELENIEIVGTVRGMDISITDLAELLKASRATSGQIVLKSDPGPEPKPAATDTETETEDSEDEE